MKIELGKGACGIGTAVPQGWLDVRGIGRIPSPPNRWRRFWAWALLGWRWDEESVRQGLRHEAVMREVDDELL